VQISIEDIKKRKDPYQLFLDSIKNEETKRKYKKALHRFLKLIPNKIYQESIGIVPEDQSLEILARLFVELASLQIFNFQRLDLGTGPQCSHRWSGSDRIQFVVDGHT